MIFQWTSQDQLKLPTKINKLVNKQKRKCTCGDFLYMFNIFTAMASTDMLSLLCTSADPVNWQVCYFAT